jgi:predicted N-acyltransferase
MPAARWPLAPAAPRRAPRAPRCAPRVPRARAAAAAAAAAATEPPPGRFDLRATLLNSVHAVPGGRAAWDACAGPDNPFVSYDFLAALEDSGSAAPREGWLPQHLVVTARRPRASGAGASGASASSDALLREGADARSIEGDAKEVAVAIVPLYLKSHSAGEYVFDQAWAEAHDGMGGGPSRRRYYPKLQACVPFSPVTGPRMLVAPGPGAEEVRADGWGGWGWL